MENINFKYVPVSEKIWLGGLKIDSSRITTYLKFRVSSFTDTHNLAGAYNARANVNQSPMASIARLPW